jgi:hypothetical protein
VCIVRSLQIVATNSRIALGSLYFGLFELLERLLDRRVLLRSAIALGP